MEKVPFSESEMVPVRVIKGMRGGPDRTIWTTPVTLRENMRAALGEHEALFLPYQSDAVKINPSIVPDNRARASVSEGGDPFVPNKDGEKDAFGIPWIFEPEAGGSMPAPGSQFFEDIADWRDFITFPDPKSWDWEAAARKSEHFFDDTPGAPRYTVLYTGFFERLISWMGFENASVAMIDEEAEDDIHEIFGKLTDYYIAIIDGVKEAFDIDFVQLHDDWGSQMGPMMSYATIEEKIIPYVTRIAEHVHENGMFLEMHSCGKIDAIVPLMIQAGVDTWMGQRVCDKKALFDQYGDKFVIQAEFPTLGYDATDDEVRAAAKAFADDFLVPGKPVIVSPYSNGAQNPSLFLDELYRLSRTIYGA